MQIALRALIAFVVTGVTVIAIMPSPDRVESYSPAKILDSGYLSHPTLLLLGLLLSLTVTGLVIYYSRRQERDYKRSRSVRMELEEKAQVLRKTESQLALANSEISEVQDHFVRTTAQIRQRVSRLLSSNRKPQDVSLLDVSEISRLQAIQDSLVEVFGVGSVIIDPDGEPLTRHRNSTDACTLIRSSAAGAKECFWHQRNLGEKSFRHRQPVYKKCKACGLMCGGSPFIVNDCHVATWIVGQVRIDNDFSFDLSASSRKIGIVPGTLVAALELAPKMSISRFRSTLELVWRFAEELSSLAFRNTQLLSDVINLKQLKPELQLAWKALDQIESGVVMLGPYSRVMAVNEPACVQLARPRKELMALNRDELEAILDAPCAETEGPPTRSTPGEETIRLCTNGASLLHEEQVTIDGQEYTYMFLGPAASNAPVRPASETEEAVD